MQCMIRQQLPKRLDISFPKRHQINFLLSNFEEVWQKGFLTTKQILDTILWDPRRKLTQMFKLWLGELQQTFQTLQDQQKPIFSSISSGNCELNEWALHIYEYESSSFHEEVLALTWLVILVFQTALRAPSRKFPFKNFRDIKSRYARQLLTSCQRRCRAARFSATLVWT